MRLSVHVPTITGASSGQVPEKRGNRKLEVLALDLSG